jgi:hypothetical protein
LPSGRGGVADLAPGEISVAVHLVGTTMNVVHRSDCPDIGPVCAERDEPPQLHDQQFYSFELRPIVGVGITDQLGAEVQIPFRLVSTTIRFRRLDGTIFEPDYLNIHHRDETLAGFGDPWLLARGTGALGPVRISARAGVGIPLGSTEENPFRLGREGVEHQHIQFGAGTFFPVFALDASVPVGPLRAMAFGQTSLFLAENDEGYRPGTRWMGGAAADGEVTQWLRLGAGVDVVNEQPERWEGRIEQDGNVGRTDLLIGGTASFRFAETSLSLAVKVPVVQHFIERGNGADPGQLTYPIVVGLSVQTTFNAPPPPPSRPAPSGVLPVR